jgi:hypothetical protein
VCSSGWAHNGTTLVPLLTSSVDTDLTSSVDTDLREGTAACASSCRTTVGCVFWDFGGTTRS